MNERLPLLRLLLLLWAPLAAASSLSAAAAAAASSFPNPGHTQSGGRAALSAPAAPCRPPPADDSVRRGSRSLKVKAEHVGRRGALAFTGEAWRVRGAGPRVCERRARRDRLADGFPVVRLSRVRPVRSLLLGPPPLLFFFRSAELMLVNKSLSLTAPPPHTGGSTRALSGPRTRARAHTPSGHSRSPGAPRAGPGLGRRQEPEFGIAGTCGAERGRGEPGWGGTAPGSSTRAGPRALTEPRARAHVSAPTRTAPAGPVCTLPSRRTPKNNARGAGGTPWLERRRLGGRAAGAVGGECSPRASLKTTTARLENAPARSVKKLHCFMQLLQNK